jgi:hypothetical protein
VEIIGDGDDHGVLLRGCECFRAVHAINIALPRRMSTQKRHRRAFFIDWQKNLDRDGWSVIYRSHGRRRMGSCSASSRA